MIYFLVIIFLIILWAYLFNDKYKESDHIIPQDSFYENSPRITLHFYSSPIGINWNSPLSLLASALINVILPLNRDISHVAVEVQSGNESQDSFYTFTSMTDTKKNAFQKLIIDKIGLGMLLAVYPGKLENPGLLQTELKRKRRYGRVHSLTYLVNEPIVQRVKQYLKEYEEVGNHLKYSGLDKHPRYKEGSGCVNFCKAVIEIAGLDDEKFHKRWNQKVKVPFSLIGKPHTENKINLGKIIFSNKGRRWAKKDEDHIKLVFWDIDKIFKNLKELGRFLDCDQPNVIINKKFIKEMKYRRISNSYEFLFDRKNNEVPTEDLWLERKNSV